MDFMIQNETRVNKFVVKILWVAYLAGFATIFGMKVVDLTVALYHEIISGAIICLFVMTIATVIWRYYTDKPFIKYVLTFSTLIALAAIIILLQEGVLLSPFWFFAIGISTFYFNLPLTVTTSAVCFIMNIILITVITGKGIDQLTLIDMIGNPFTFLISASAMVFTVYLSRGFIMRIKDSEKNADNTRALMEQVFTTLKDYIISLSEGNLDMDIKISTDDDRLAGSCIQLRDTLKSLISDMNDLSESAVKGMLALRGDDTKYSGDFAKIISGVNNTLEAVINPINETSAILSEIAKFNLSVDTKETYQGDFASIEKALGLVKDNIKNIIQELTKTIRELKKSSAELSASSDAMVANSEEANAMIASSVQTAVRVAGGMADVSEVVNTANNNVAMVATAVEQINNSAGVLASASKLAHSGADQAVNMVHKITAGIGKTAEYSRQVTNSVNNVVTAIKEINISLNEVNHSCNISISITADAKLKAEATNQIINELSIAIKEISNIADIIKKIADKTNMLSLNAAIEAAGAGEAGKGFAVVAGEVKDLARQTRTATEDISLKIVTMSELMGKAVDAVSTITGVTEEVNSITNTITAAVTEQSASINEISGSVVETGKKVDDIDKDIQEINITAEKVAKSVSESAEAVNDIVKSTSELHAASNKAAVNAEQVAGLLNDVNSAVQKSAADIETISANMEEMDNASGEIAESARHVNELGINLAQVASALEDLSNKLSGGMEQY